MTGLPALHANLEAPRPELRCDAALKLGSAGNSESLRLLDEAARDPIPLVSAFAQLGRDKLSQRLAAEGTTALDALHASLASVDVRERTAAALHLAALQHRESLAPLLGALDRETEPAALAALIRSILRFGDPSNVELGLRFLQHPHDDVRVAAVEGFWVWPDETVTEAVRQLQEDENKRVRFAVKVFEVRRGGEQGKAQAEALLLSTEPGVKLLGLLAIGPLAETWVRQLLADTIRDDKRSTAERVFAREVAGIFAAAAHRGARAPSAGQDQTIRTDLTRHYPVIATAEDVRKALQGQDPVMRVHGLQNVSRFPAEDSLPAMLRLTHWETDAMVQATLVKALGRIGGPAHAPALLKFLDHADPRVRANTLEGLSLAGGDIDLVDLCKKKLVDDHAHRVRSQAAALLFARDHLEGVRHFREMVLGKEPPLRESALLIMTTLRDARTLTIFREALVDPRREVYAAAQQVLENLGAEWSDAHQLHEDFKAGRVAGEVVEGEPVKALLEAMNSGQATDRIRAMGKLVQAKDPRVQTVLELCLSSRDPAVRREATQALRRRHERVTLPALYRQLGDQHTQAVQEGYAWVPRDLGAALDAAADAGAGAEDLGKLLYQAFERDVPFHSRLRMVCGEIRAAMDHLAGEGAPAGAPDAPAADREKLFASVLEAQEQAAAPLEVEEVEAPAPSRRWAMGAALAAAVVGSLAFGRSRLESSPEVPSDLTALPAAQARKLLDTAGFELDGARFRDRFAGRRVALKARLESVGDDLATAHLRCGSIPLKVTPASLTDRLPRDTKLGATCEIRGVVRDRQSDGTIVIEGDLKMVAP